MGIAFFIDLQQLPIINAFPLPNISFGCDVWTPRTAKLAGERGKIGRMSRAEFSIDVGYSYSVGERVHGLDMCNLRISYNWLQGSSLDVRLLQPTECVSKSGKSCVPSLP
jgi:hypothetical protein